MENPPAALALLPDDLLADILTRLAPRDLAMALGVCKAWRAVIDAHRLLRVDLLPFSLGGIFINFNGQVFSEYFFEPSTTPAISSMSDYVPHSPWIWRQVESHCNGLLLLSENYVVNPATRWWAQLPTPLCPELSNKFSYRNYLVFDPILSPHYEVFSVPHIRISLLDGKYRAIKPPSDTQIDEALALGKSKDGVYLASLDITVLRIWVLRESCGQTEWLLKYRADLKWKLREKLGSSWVLQDVNYYDKYNRLAIRKEEPRVKARAETDVGPFYILGFHPFQDVVFLSRSLRWGLAYHLTSSKLQYLGYLYPTEYNNSSEGEDILDAYPYTPCWM
ncbi:hypothetical protein QOZ80_3BG0268700 [Eleusine coracana subsp. coracana]|nr:hypothetical protein QOZ80_3BG0268700 [Eleusine coracana subsp. coracana]